MVVRQMKHENWERVYRQITAQGSSSPMSLQYDIGISCNGMNYVLRVQYAGKRRIAVLQAVCINAEGGCRLVDDNLLLNALMEIIVFQSTRAC